MKPLKKKTNTRKNCKMKKETNYQRLKKPRIKINKLYFNINKSQGIIFILYYFYKNLIFNSFLVFRGLQHLKKISRDYKKGYLN